MSTLSDSPRSYLSRIEALEVAVTDDHAFLMTLRQQEWIVRAAEDATVDPRLKALCAHLLSLILADDPRPDQVRRTVQQIILLWKNLAEKDSSEGMDFAVRLGLAASVATIIAFLLGDQGLIPLLQRLSPTGATHVASPPQRWIVTQFESGVIYFHVLVLFLLLTLQFTRFGKPQAIDNPNPGTPEIALAQFRRGWLGIWASWFAAYSWLSIGYYLQWYERSWMWAVADIFNVINGIGFFYCFLVLDEPSLPIGDNHPKQFKKDFAAVIIIGAVLVVLSIIGRLWPDSPLKHSGTLLVSCYTGLAMAYLVGRFDSHHMNVPRPVLAPLYLYVMIQLTWVVLTFNDEVIPINSTVRTVFLGSALLFKMLLFFVVNHWLIQGTLLTYIKKQQEFFKNESLDVLRHTAAAGAP